MPYKGLRGNGTANVETDPDKTVLTELLDRYLGGTDSPLAERLLSPDRQEVWIWIDPEQVYTWDFSERMADSAPRDR